MSRQGEIKSRARGRASIPTPPVKFPLDDTPGQVVHRQKPRRETKQSRGLAGWLVSFASRVTLFYLVYAALWTCPSRPFAFDYSANDSRPVCRNLAHAHDQLAPVVKPYIHLAQQKAEPYTRPVVDAATPWVNRAHKVSRPIYREANKRGRLIWKKRIDPARRRALKNAHKQLDPYLRQAQHYHRTNVQPYLDTAHKAVKPYYDIYHRDVSPYVQQAYQYSLHSSSVSYAFYMDKVHPRVVQSLQQLYSFFVNHVDPAVRRFYSLYVRPQLERLLEKVYERKAHWLGSKAIKTAQQEMKQTAKDADKHAKESVMKAEQDAIKLQTDPSLLDRVKQAKDAVFDSAANHGGEKDPVKIAQLDAELDAEEEKVKGLLEVWENGMTDLIEKEYKLAIDRLADLRNRRLSDLPERFGLVNEAFVEDTVALLLHRVERGLRKLSSRSSDTASDLTEKLAAGNKLVDQQIAKFDDAAQDTKAQISAFYEELLQQERQAIETSSAEVRRYALAAKEAYDGIMRDAKFAVTMDEWQGWDIGVRKRASLFSEELSAVQSNRKPVSSSSGAINLRTEAPDMQKEIDSLRSWTDKLHSSARKELVAYCDAALAQLGGTGVAARISDITDRLVEQASRISTDAAAGMLGAVGAARSKLKLGEPATDGYIARAKAYIASGTGSGSSFDDYMSTLNANLGAAAGSAAGSVASVAEQARSGIASVGGATSSPAAAKASAAVVDAASVVASNVQAAASSANSAAASAASQGSSALSKASRSAASVVGASPTPETFEDYVDAFNAGVEAAVDTAVDRAASVSSSGSSLASKVSRSAASALGASPTPETVQDHVEMVKENVNAAAGMVREGFESGASSASSIASAASRSVASAAGASPSPKTPADYIEVAQQHASGIVDAAASSADVVYASASSIASHVSQSASSLAGDSVEYLSSAAGTAASSVASVAQSGSSVASEVASKASRSVVSAVGASPTPETVGDYVEDVKEAVKSAAGAMRAHVEL